MELEKQQNFDRFFKIGASFEMPTFFKNFINRKQRKKLHGEVNYLIRVGNIEVLSQILDNGYRLDQHQVFYLLNTQYDSLLEPSHEILLKSLTCSTKEIMETCKNLSEIAKKNLSFTDIHKLDISMLILKKICEIMPSVFHNEQENLSKISSNLQDYIKKFKSHLDYWHRNSIHDEKKIKKGENNLYIVEQLAIYMNEIYIKSNQDYISSQVNATKAIYGDVLNNLADNIRSLFHNENMINKK